MGRNQYRYYNIIVKKYINILTALILLASCAKSEVSYEASGEVTLAPVKGNVTKAEGNSGALKDLENPPMLHIWSRWDQDADHWYIDDDLFAYNDSYKAWAGEQGSYPWPLNGSLTFAGYTHPTTTSYVPGYHYEENFFSFNKYVNDEFDFCWFGLTEGYNNKNNGDAVPVVLNHALSWITIKAYGEGTPVGKWIINSLTLESAINKGKAICYGDTSDGTTGKAIWEAEVSLENHTGDYILKQKINHTIEEPKVEGTTKTGTLLTDNIIIPQTPTNLIINYSYQDGTETRTDSKKVSLKLNEGNTTKWLSGVHYTYTLVFKSNDIQVAPSFGTWGSADQNITVE